MKLASHKKTPSHRMWHNFFLAVLTIILVSDFTLLRPIKASAFPGNYFWFPSGRHVRIMHPDSGLYLGIDRNGMNQNGARIQLQRYEENNQNQIFYLQPAGKDEKGRYQYKIRVHGENNMIIEIRDSSHDDFASAAQWSDHDGACAKWYFFIEGKYNDDSEVTCCIRNVESGKMLNVEGNKGFDGNNLIQYHEDNTAAEVFKVITVENRKTSAIWTRDWSNADGLYWSIHNDTKANRKSYNTPINQYGNGNIGHPVVYDENGKTYLASVIWADEALQKKLLQIHNSPSSGWDQIKDALFSAFKEEALGIALSKTSLGSIPIASLMGLVNVIMAGQSENQWYTIEKAIQDHSYVRIEIYYYFKSGNGWTSCQAIVNDETDTYWDGDFSTVRNTVTDYWGNNVEGSLEYLYK